ncbi:MAG: tetratricopeptide repeat-containing sensor histidine kinase [Saprospiraceae bacterium]|nr:tetratricopeptide repeat-containing sensor histidine kinase [Saprospiraceae bacterium]
MMHKGLIFIFIIILLCKFSVSENQQRIDSLTQIVNTKSGEEKINALCELGDIFKSSDPEKALEYGKQALGISEKSGYIYGKAWAFSIIASYHHNTGNYQESIKNFSESLSILKELNKYSKEASVCIGIGNSYFLLSDFDKAFEFYIRASKLYEDLGDENGYAMAISSTGFVYRSKNEFDKAIQNYEIALEIWERKNDFTGITSTLNNMGVVYLQMKDYEKANEYFLKSLELHKTNNSPEHKLLNLYNNIANAYSGLKNYKEALKNYNDALRISKSINNKYAISVIQVNMAGIHLDLKNYSNALLYSDSALTVAKEISAVGMMYNCYEKFAAIYSEKGDYEKALVYKEQYYTLKDSVFTEESSKRIEELEVKYDTEKKEKKITIQDLEIKKKENQNLFLFIIASLVLIIAIIVIFQYRIKIRRNNELKQANQKLIESEKNLKQINDTKDKLFSIISHDLKNPFGTLITVAEFLEESFHEIDEDHKFKTIQTIRKSAKQTYELLENLSQWSISQSKQLQIFPTNFDVSRTVGTTITLVKLTAQKKNINIISEINKDTFVFADENYIKIVLRNLVTNAIKFTDNEGEIKISAKFLSKYIEIVVADSGIGLLKDDIDKLFRLDVNPATIGISKVENSKFISEKGTGLGLIMCKEFVEKNGGRIWVESKFGEGSNFKFTLPKGKQNV